MIPVALLLASLATQTDPAVYSGREHQLDVRPPRAEADLAVDGRLDEPVWASAARLVGFSQFAPSDGRPAEDSTVVLVWYSPTALHVGVRAYEAHGAVHATLADRDRIGADDYVLLLLDTFLDRRQASVFGANALGVQQDGTLNEAAMRGGGQGLGGGPGGAGAALGSVSLSADFVYESRGRLTDGGYEVEIRIPFKSLRFRPGRAQSWGLNVVRVVQHSGYQDSWAPARRSGASLLAQSGTLSGLTDLRRGLVLDLTPEATASAAGSPAAGGDWRYGGTERHLGGTARWGITNNLTLNATARPDFSQVESDASQLVFDPRNAIYLDEKRPFFLDGIEQFDTPNQLIYTRAIVQPEAAVKLSGKLSGTNIGYIAAADDRDASVSGRRPIYNLLRVRRDLGDQSALGLTYTDRADGRAFNRVAEADARFVFRRLYSLRLQGAASATRDVAGERGTVTAPLWEGVLERTGRTFGLRYGITGIDRDFRAESGFLTRTGIVHGSLTHRLTRFGRPGARVESWNGSFTLDGTWDYDHFVDRRRPQDVKWHFDAGSALRGGWRVGAGLFLESFGYDPSIYADYAIERRTATGVDTVPFVGQPHIPNAEGYIQIGTPQWPRFSASLFALWGNDENFFEWASGEIWIATLGLNWRPTDKARVSLDHNLQTVTRRTDRSRVASGYVPRLKLEYQIARPVFVRVVGEYAARYRDALRDDSRTGGAILVRDGAGGYAPTSVERENGVRGDALFAYQPSPGTVVFLGYGSTLDEASAFRFRGLRRRSDGLFAKVSYLFRL